MDLLQYYGKDPAEILASAGSRAEGIAILEAIAGGFVDGSAFPDGLPVDVKLKRARCLESPFYLATEILDPYYKEHFSEVHRRAMDEVISVIDKKQTTIEIIGAFHQDSESPLDIILLQGLLRGEKMDLVISRRQQNSA